jgi:hypothetical protein
MIDDADLLPIIDEIFPTSPLPRSGGWAKTVRRRPTGPRPCSCRAVATEAVLVLDAWVAVVAVYPSASAGARLDERMSG